jgi:signal transduction histidine kinase/ActR/RegA family two-component response regulator
MFGSRQKTGSRAPQILRRVGFAYFLIVIGLIALVGYRQFDAIEQLKKGGPGGQTATSISRMSLLSERALGYATLLAGASNANESRYRKKLADALDSWRDLSGSTASDLSGTSASVKKAIAEINRTGKPFEEDLKQIQSLGPGAQAAALIDDASGHQSAYGAAVDSLANAYLTSAPSLTNTIQGHLYLTAGLFAAAALLISLLLFRPLLSATRKAIEFEQARFVIEKERVFKEKNEEVSEKMISEIQAKQVEMQAQAEALEVALARAEEVNRLKTAFLANMSHEIRTPMNHVIGMAELLSQTSLAAEQREWLRTIISSGNQLVTIINDILDLSQIEAGKLGLDPQRVNLRHLITDAVRPFEAEAKEKNIGIAVWLAAGVTEEIVTDPVRLRQILTNLISNSIKFTSEGRIDVSAETILAGDRLDLRISVKDTGIGIDPARAKAIFESFTQADVSTKRMYGGTGLGLTIVKQLVELMGGTIDLKSTPGAGSEFTVTVPAAAGPETPRSGGGGSPHQITDLPNLNLSCLVVEDNLVNQKVLVKLLEKLGCRVETVEDGETAVALANARSYDVILMDIHMPGKDGVEATKDIRAREKLGRKSPIPIVAVTADAMQEDRQRFIEAGMDDYVAKPVRQATLVPILSRFRKMSPV